MNKKMMLILMLAIACAPAHVAAYSYQMLAGITGVVSLAAMGIVKRYKQVARYQVRKLVAEVKRQAAQPPISIEDYLKRKGTPQPSGYTMMFLNERDYSCVSSHTVKAADLYLVKLTRFRAWPRHLHGNVDVMKSFKEARTDFNAQLKSYGIEDEYFAPEA